MIFPITNAVDVGKVIEIGSREQNSEPTRKVITKRYPGFLTGSVVFAIRSASESDTLTIFLILFSEQQTLSKLAPNTINISHARHFVINRKGLDSRDDTQPKCST